MVVSVLFSFALPPPPPLQPSCASDADNSHLLGGKLLVDMSIEMVRLTLAVIGQAGLGVDLSEAVEVIPARNGVMHRLSLR